MALSDLIKRATPNMALSDLIKRATPNNADKLSDAIARLQTERDAARQALDVASSNWGDSLADEETGDSDTATTIRLEKELNAASQAFKAKDAALTAAKARQVATTTSAARAELETKWTQAGVLAAERCAAAAKFKRSLEAAARDYQTFIQLGSDLTAALPESPDLDAAMLRSTDVEIAIKKEMLRVGFDFVFSWPYGKVSLPNFLEPFEATAQLVRQWRDSAMAKARR
jgi:hypothetical protein